MFHWVAHFLAAPLFHVGGVIPFSLIMRRFFFWEGSPSLPNNVTVIGGGPSRGFPFLRRRLRAFHESAPVSPEGAARLSRGVSKGAL